MAIAFNKYFAEIFAGNAKIKDKNIQSRTKYLTQALIFV